MKRRNQNYILFVDESGKSKLPDTTGNGKFLLSGVIMDKSLHLALSDYMISMKEKHSISTYENLHAFDLFENEKAKRGEKLKIKEIEDFFARFYNLIQGAEMYSILLRIDKQNFQKQISKKAKKLKVKNERVAKELKKQDLHDFLYESLARKMILEFGHFLSGRDAYGEVVAESRRQDDDAILRAFIGATGTSKYQEGTLYNVWSRQSFEHIHSLTFQNKKGLSFGLEVADLFAWGHFNLEYGLSRHYKKAKEGRINSRLKRVETNIKNSLLKSKCEDITITKLKTLADDRVSRFTKFLTNVSFSDSGDPATSL
ncbi:MAG: DUF3800 domain-containing protein [Patescibacteria group bacterium]